MNSRLFTPRLLDNLSERFKAINEQLEGVKNKSYFPTNRLWMITDKNTGSTSYLLGTDHSCHISSFSSDKMRNILDSVDAVYCEVDPDGDDNFDQIADRVKKIPELPSDTNKLASDALSKDTYKSISGFFTSHSYPEKDRINDLNKIESFSLRKFSFFFAMMLIFRFESLHENVISKNDSETYIWKEAKKSRKIVGGLESDATRLNDLLNSYSYEALVKENDYAADLLQLYRLAFLFVKISFFIGSNVEEKYFNDRIDLQEIKSDEMSCVYLWNLFPFGKNLLNARNEQMFKSMQHEMKSKSNLFAVGYAHLQMGENGLLKLLHDNDDYVCTPLESVNKYAYLSTLSRQIKPALIAATLFALPASMIRSKLLHTMGRNPAYSFSKFKMAAAVTSSVAGVSVVKGIWNRCGFLFHNNKMVEAPVSVERSDDPKPFWF